MNLYSSSFNFTSSDASRMWLLSNSFAKRPRWARGTFSLKRLEPRHCWARPLRLRDTRTSWRWSAFVWINLLTSWSTNFAVTEISRHFSEPTEVIFLTTIYWRYHSYSYGMITMNRSASDADLVASCYSSLNIFKLVKVIPLNVLSNWSLKEKLSLLCSDKVHQLEADNLILRFCRDITSGLSHLHRTNCIPNDLTARTCQVDHFYNVKVRFCVRSGWKGRIMTFFKFDILWSFLDHGWDSWLLSLRLHFLHIPLFEHQFSRSATFHSW